MKELQFSVVVFDTAPTGHTLRFLSMPTLFQKGMGKVTQLKSRFGSVFDQVSDKFSQVFFVSFINNIFCCLVVAYVEHWRWWKP